MSWSFRITQNTSQYQLAWTANTTNGSYSLAGSWTTNYTPIFSNIVGCRVAHFRRLQDPGSTGHTRRNISCLGFTWYQAYQEWRSGYDVEDPDLIIVNPNGTDKIALILTDGHNTVNVTSTVFENNNCQYLNSDSAFNSLMSLINTTISSESSASSYSSYRNRSNYPVTQAASVINAAKNSRTYMLPYNNLMALTLSVNSTPQDTATSIKNNATSYWNTINASVNSGWEHYITANNKYNEIIAGYNAIVSRDTRLLDHADKSELNSARSSLLFNYNKIYNDGFADYNSVKTILDKNKIITN